MTDIEIKPASEIPNDRLANGTEKVRYPFGLMNVGEAFKLPAKHHGSQTTGPKSPTSRVAVAASAYGKRRGMKFKCQRQKDGGVRVERIA